MSIGAIDEESYQMDFINCTNRDDTSQVASLAGNAMYGVARGYVHNRYPFLM